MRENRTCGSEGGEGNLPDPYHGKTGNRKRRGFPRRELGVRQARLLRDGAQHRALASRLCAVPNLPFQVAAEAVRGHVAGFVQRLRPGWPGRRSPER
jgi:hypothetical protein